MNFGNFDKTGDVGKPYLSASNASTCDIPVASGRTRQAFVCGMPANHKKAAARRAVIAADTQIDKRTQTDRPKTD